jgi:hypothetical protein
MLINWTSTSRISKIIFIISSISWNKKFNENNSWNDNLQEDVNL